MTVTHSNAPTPTRQKPPRQSLIRSLVGEARIIWRRLTSMRTALVLLFLLALAAIPGALLPQRNLNAGKVATYIAARPTLGPWMDKLELFDVFGSFWFTAIYVLLFVSLIGCLIPRLIDHLRALRSKPVPVPRNLSRLPHHHHGVINATTNEVTEQARAALRGWRVAIYTESDGGRAVSAERGYLREAGNLVFHFSLIGLLAAVAIGKLFGYEGSVIVIANGGPGFCNTSPAVYDSFRTGNATDGTGLEPFCIQVKDFKADYLDSGQAEMFTSNISYQTGASVGDDAWQDYQLRVNDPLRIGGERIYLTGHGYAPQFTVTFPDGQTRTESLQFRPDDATTFLSSGALRFDPPGGTYSTPEERRKNQIAIEGLFAPTAYFNGTLLTSVFPGMRDPAVAVDIYKGDTGLDTGIPQSIFSLNSEMINQGRLVKQDRVNLRPGESTTLPDGSQVRFDGAQEFANLQVSHDPAQKWVLVFAISMMAGLLVSLVIKRRRIWVRIRPGTSDTETNVELGGLARTDHAGWGPEFTTMCERLWPDATRQDE
ncbi:cytochrome c biogenesis protein ResB [Rhodococcus oxybenzonivorans]